MSAPARRKDNVIQIRASAEAKAVLNRAAALRGQKLSEFMLQSARRQAEETILDQRTFFLDDEFTCALSGTARLATRSICQGSCQIEPESAVGRVSAASPQLRAPEPLASSHDLTLFTNGVHASLEQCCVSERVRAKRFPRGLTWFAPPQNRIALSAIFRSRPP